MKIVIEGMDGVGKSSVAKILAEKIGAKYVDGLMKGFLKESGLSDEDINVVKHAIDISTDNENSIIRTWMYGFANVFNLLHYEEDLVIDRHCLTTYFYNGDDESKDIYKFMQTIAGKPDLIIILRASEETRRQRICGRDVNDSDLLSEKKMCYGYDEIESAAKYLELNYAIVDTDDKDMNQVIDEIIEILERG